MSNEIKTIEIKGVSVRGYQGLVYVEPNGTARVWDSSAQDDALGLSVPFCACGRRLTECDGSRKGCYRPNRGSAP